MRLCWLPSINLANLYLYSARKTSISSAIGSRMPPRADPETESAKQALMTNIVSWFRATLRLHIRRRISTGGACYGQVERSTLTFLLLRPAPWTSSSDDRGIRSRGDNRELLYVCASHIVIRCCEQVLIRKRDGWSQPGLNQRNLKKGAPLARIYKEGSEVRSRSDMQSRSSGDPIP
jgi:hypothetical protein